MKKLNSIKSFKEKFPKSCLDEANLNQLNGGWVEVWPTISSQWGADVEVWQYNDCTGMPEGFVTAPLGI